MFDWTKNKNQKDWLAYLGKTSKIPFGMFDILMASFFINVLSLVMPLALLQIYDRILPNNSINTMAMLVLGIAIALLMEAFLRIGRTYLSGWIGARFEHMAGCASVERILSTSVNEFEKEGSGVHLERLSALGTLKEFYAGQAIITLFDLPFSFLFLALISYLAGSLVFVPIFLIVAFAIFAWRIGNLLRSALSERMVADERRFNFIIEVLTGVHTLKSMSMETQMLRRYERLQEACAKSDFAVTRHSSSAMGLGALFSQITMFTVVGFGSTFVIDGELTVGGLAACTMLSGRAMQPLQRAVGIWARFQSIQLSRAKLKEIFELKPETEGKLPSLDSGFRGRLELKNVGLQFNEEDDPLFYDINLKIEPGQIVGISGGNASGKSSLLYLMMGAMRASVGEVLIDGQNINDLDPTSVRRKIAYLPQHGVLFNGTIIDNLTMFKSELEDKALRIARLLGLDEVVARMPLGYDTVVGNGAYDSLPRGIKQRIAIGRALMTDPVVLLFDEANAAMDSAGDKVLTEFLQKAGGNRTLILVSHRPSLLKMADVVYDLKDGSLEKRDMQQPVFTPPKPSVPAIDEKAKDASPKPAVKETPKPSLNSETGKVNKKDQQSVDKTEQNAQQENVKKPQPEEKAIQKPVLQKTNSDTEDNKPTVKKVVQKAKVKMAPKKPEAKNEKPVQPNNETEPKAKIKMIEPENQPLAKAGKPKFVLKKRNNKTDNGDG